MIFALKIIGITLLCILALLLLFLILVLFLPWRIRGRFLLNDEKIGYLKASSFFTFFRARIEYDKDIKVVVSIFFGLYKFVNNTIDLNLHKSKDESVSDESVSPKSEDEGTLDESVTHKTVDSVTKKKEAKETKESKKTKEDKKAKDEKKSKKIDFSNIFSDTNSKAFKRLLKKLKKLIDLFHFSLRGTEVDFAFSDPSLTGKTTGILALFPFTYSEDVRIMPHFDWDETKVNGQINLKGRIILFKVLILVLQVYKDKEMMGLFKAGGEKNG
jgi:hypothetical protein